MSRPFSTLPQTLPTRLRALSVNARPGNCRGDMSSWSDEMLRPEAAVPFLDHIDHSIERQLRPRDTPRQNSQEHDDDGIQCLSLRHIRSFSITFSLGCRMFPSTDSGKERGEALWWTESAAHFLLDYHPALPYHSLDRTPPVIVASPRGQPNAPRPDRCPSQRQQSPHSTSFVHRSISFEFLVDVRPSGRRDTVLPSLFWVAIHYCVPIVARRR